MQTRVILLLVAASATIGFTGGFYLATALQKQIEALIGTAIVLAFLTWFGSGTDFMPLLRDWYRETLEAKKRPVLNFDGLFIDNEVYLLRVRKVSGEGYAEAVEGFLTIPGTEVIDRPTVWYRNGRRCQIGLKEDLRLFLVGTDDFDSENMVRI